MATVADLRPCNVTLVRVPLGRDGASVVVERRLAPSVRRVNAKYLADPRSHQYPIRKGDTGAFNCRHVTGGSAWSKHAYGAAVDENWITNGYNASHHDKPAWLVAIWKSEGWGWGGDWNRVKDWMHFSKFPNEGGDGKLEEPGQEDDLANVPQDEWATVKSDVEKIKEAVFKKKGGVTFEHLNRIDNMLVGLGSKMDPPIVFKDDGTIQPS